MYSGDDVTRLRPVTSIAIHSMLWNMSEIQLVDDERDALRYVRCTFVSKGHTSNDRWVSKIEFAVR